MEETLLKPKRKNKYIPLGMARNFDHVGPNPSNVVGFGGGIFVTRFGVKAMEVAPVVLVRSMSRGIDSHKFDWYEELCLSHLEGLR